MSVTQEVRQSKREREREREREETSDYAGEGNVRKFISTSVGCSRYFLCVWRIFFRVW